MSRRRLRLSPWVTYPRALDGKCTKSKTGTIPCATNSYCTRYMSGTACVDGLCECACGHYEEQGGDVCTKIKLDQTCGVLPAPGNVTPDCGCAITNATCQDGTCQCKSGLTPDGDYTCLLREYIDAPPQLIWANPISHTMSYLIVLEYLNIPSHSWLLSQKGIRCAVVILIYNSNGKTSNWTFL